MAHLLKFRKGWKNEHIAKFILSQFSFVAEPATIADDIGSDFICTLFKIDDNENLIPQNSFTIQIKSNKNNIEITKNYSYFQNLEIPFLVGVVDKEKLTMRIYSGEAIPHCFSSYTGAIVDRHYRAFIRLMDSVENRNHNFISHDASRRECYLDFPFIIELSAKGPNNVDAISEICKLIQYNISSRSINSYLFYLYGWNVASIYIGEDSFKYFRENFYKRLTEVILNLEWLYDKNRAAFDYDEYQIYKSTIEKIIEKYRLRDSILGKSFARVDAKISGEKSAGELNNSTYLLTSSPADSE